eukprot:TRINITY_DN30393_c0_g1_i1.p1 TRINITY_DN30393_c0_g1~~TRINITY_DN30393_c0_g1_i1.p1  ORF type:complete len:186 (+),score=17.23 TRINITY_DN30393_c0_g1_i1:61-618(+)
MSIEISDSLVGKKVSVKTVNGETFEGIIYGYDQSQNCIALFEMPSGQTRSRGRYTFKMFNITHLQSLTPIDGGSADASFIEQFKSGDLPKINTQKIQERANTAREKRAANMGTDVSIEGQDVFDAISRTLRCTWDNATIVVLDVVTIVPPYGTENMKEKEGGGARAQQTLEQVKKILKDRLQRIR